MNDATKCYTGEAIGTFALTFIGGGAIVTDAFTHGGVGLVGQKDRQSLAQRRCAVNGGWCVWPAI